MMMLLYYMWEGVMISWGGLIDSLLIRAAMGAGMILTILLC